MIAGDTNVAENRTDCAGFHAADIEKGIFFGQKFQGVRNGQPFRMMDGIISIVSNLAYYPASYSATNVTVAGATTNYTQFEAAFDPCFNQTTDPKYANERVVFDRPIGQNQGVQHPLAEAWMKLETTNLMMLKAATLYDQGKPCGAEANTAKYMCAEAGFEAAQTAVFTHGGYGYAKEFHVERLMREVMLFRLAPVSPQLIKCFIAEKVLGLPRSY